MTLIRREIVFWAQIITFVIIWLIVLFLAGISPIINWEAIKVLPEVVTIYAILHYIFTAWAWRLPLFQGWLIMTPILQGTWKGMIETTWTDPNTGERLDPIPAYLAIRQTFYSVSVSMFTKESHSTSIAAVISISADGGTKTLNYDYQNTPGVIIRDRSQVHAGAAALRITTKPELMLDGEYWTNRKSTGQMKLEYIGKELIERYPES